MSQEQLMNRVAHLWRYCKQTQGSQIAEFAISLPLLAVVVIGITDFGSAFDLKYKLSNAVREGARFASRQSTSDVTNATPASVTAVRDLIDSYLVGDHVSDCGLATASPAQAGLVWTYTANTRCPGGGTLTTQSGYRCWSRIRKVRSALSRSEPRSFPNRVAQFVLKIECTPEVRY